MLSKFIDRKLGLTPAFVVYGGDLDLLASKRFLPGVHSLEVGILALENGILGALEA